MGYSSLKAKLPFLTIQAINSKYIIKNINVKEYKLL